MRCKRPFRRGFDHAGNLTTLKSASKEFSTIEFPCRTKCLRCRLYFAREKAIRCWHESKMHEKSMFLTLTYSDEHLESPWLIYEHFQKFMKDLRDRVGYAPEDRISYIVTGEYGEKNKRPHWHAIIFNFWPEDAKIRRTTELEHKVYTSDFVDDLWGRNDKMVRPSEIGSVTLESAGYVARYAAKKLVHGKDQDHRYHPIHKTSKGRAIGRSWIEKHFEHVFSTGYVNLPNGSTAGIPRYYQDWVKKYHPLVWEDFVFNVRSYTEVHMAAMAEVEVREYIEAVENRRLLGSQAEPEKRSQIEERILKQKFERLQERLKL